VKVAFIGLGRIGTAMAERVLAGGHDLMVWNRTPEKTDAIVAAGARRGASIGEAAAHGGIVMTMLANDEALEAVAYGPGGLVETLPRGGVHVCEGTHSVALVRKLAEDHAKAGQTLVSAPVLGRPEAVRAGRLGVIVAGPPEAVARCQPLFEALGRRTFPMGEEPGGAAAVKIANNLLLACAIEAIGEAFALAEKTGVERHAFLEVLTDGLFACPAYQGYGQIIADNAYHNLAFTAVLGLKDVNLALAAGDLVRVPLPSGNAVRDRLLGAIANGDGELDWSVMAREQARASGLG
jgi:3-hydroxyisobutyrate dehydrogenase-like beta-hydroxyacid dehydrogenase